MRPKYRGKVDKLIHFLYKVDIDKHIKNKGLAVNIKIINFHNFKTIQTRTLSGGVLLIIPRPATEQVKIVAISMQARLISLYEIFMVWGLVKRPLFSCGIKQTPMIVSPNGKPAIQPFFSGINKIVVHYSVMVSIGEQAHFF